ncbi:hypothetical protein PG999_004582 [Apiospora kogelbergensis]|uniref:ATP-dependent DNA helicase n=1 Tax=Apiospora kogelbergensis TaxID=1337665 RepID=A0AAW0QZM7_9PEZI
MAKSMKLSSMSLEVLKLCMQYFQAINHTQTSTYKEVEQSVQLTFQEVLQSASSFKTVTSEKTLEKAIFDYAGSITTMSSTTFASVNSLVTTICLSAAGTMQVTCSKGHCGVEECVDLVRRLAECYSIRQRKAEEEDIRVRLYRAMRSGGKVDDKLWEQVTQELLSFYTKTRQTEAGITLTHPRPVSIEYYQKIIRVLNGDGFITKPEVLKPILLVATELWTKGAFSEAMLYYKTLFSTFFAVPKSSPTFQDQTLMRECFDRYLECLRHTKMTFSVVHKLTVGGGGTGKWGVINAIKDMFRRKGGQRNLLTGASGNAAALIGGVTLHSAANIRFEGATTRQGGYRRRRRCGAVEEQGDAHHGRDQPGRRVDASGGRQPTSAVPRQLAAAVRRSPHRDLLQRLLPVRTSAADEPAPAEA